MEHIVKRLFENKRLKESTTPEFLCKSIKVDNDGVMEIICYDKEYDEEFEKYIGQVDSPSALKNARLILRDTKFEVPKDIKNELIGTFGLEDYGYKIEENHGDDDLSPEDVQGAILDLETAIDNIDSVIGDIPYSMREEIEDKLDELGNRLTKLSNDMEDSELIDDDTYYKLDKKIRKLHSYIDRVRDKEYDR